MAKKKEKSKKSKDGSDKKKKKKKKNKKSGGSSLDKVLLSPDQFSKEIKNKDKQRKKREKEYMPMLSIKDGMSKTVRFLDKKPVIVPLHIFDKGRTQFVCRQNADADGCPLCEDGHKPTLYAHFNVIDRTGYKDREGKKVKNIVCCLKASSRFFTVITHHQKRKGLLKRDYEITRNGEGTQTTYLLDAMDKKVVAKDKHLDKLDIRSKFTVPSYEEALNAAETHSVDDN